MLSVTTSRYAVREQLRSGNAWRSVAQQQSVCSGRIQQEGVKCRGCATLFAYRKHSGAKFVVSHRAKNLLDQKRTTRQRAKSLLSLQSIVYKAMSSILQVSQADGLSHRRSEVDLLDHLVGPSFKHLGPITPIPNSTGNPFIGGVKYTGVGKIGDFRSIFDVHRRLSRKRCEIGRWLLWNVNSKSWVPDWMG